MTGGLLLLAAAAVGVLLWALRPRRPAPPPPLPPAEQALLQRLPQYAQLSAGQRERLAEQVAAFVRDKDYYGCNGLQVDREMAVLLAAQACLLSLREAGAPYPQLRSVLVYPGAFVVHDPEPDELGIVSDEPEERIGESWDAQRIVVSWPDAQQALAGSPVNVVVHECAHQLDPLGQGRPEGADPQRWAAVMAPAYEALQRHGSPVIDEYGCESPAEFFAVLCESYVQEPAALQQAHPALYAELERHFGLALAAT